jgi:hypothetical protein
VKRDWYRRLAVSLTATQRAELDRRLAVSLTATQRAELDRRLDDLEREGPLGIPWNEVARRNQNHIP